MQRMELQPLKSVKNPAYALAPYEMGFRGHPKVGNFTMPASYYPPRFLQKDVSEVMRRMQAGEAILDLAVPPFILQ